MSNHAFPIWHRAGRFPSVTSHRIVSSIFIRASILAFLPVLILAVGQAQHFHINAGAASPTPGALLYFPNGARYITNAGYVLTLTLATNGPYAGFYETGAISFTSLPSTGDNGGPAFGHAAPGARLALQVVSVQGPTGGSFGFWESVGGEDATDLTFSVSVGESNGLQQFLLSENDGSPGTDPYGHVHGRKFSATLPGLYVVGFRIIDISNNGSNGGPLHPPSDLVFFNFQASATLLVIRVSADSVELQFATQTGRSYTIESNSVLDDSKPWKAVGGPLNGDDHLQTASVPNASTGAGFYRLRIQ